jgi:hypothetical protein
VKVKGVEFCCDCDDFPCAFLAPTADNATRYPHNMKVYNLCRIKKVGLERWIEEAGQIRKKYFTANLLSEEDKRIRRMSPSYMIDNN